MVVLRTVCDCPPIPIRSFDWAAYDENAYSPCYDPDCSCHRSIGNIVGHGETEEQAIIDFVQQLCEEMGVEAANENILG